MDIVTVGLQSAMSKFLEGERFEGRTTTTWPEIDVAGAHTIMKIRGVDTEPVSGLNAHGVVIELIASYSEGQYRSCRPSRFDQSQKRYVRHTQKIG